MKIIRRIPEGHPIPDPCTVLQVLLTEDEPTGSGTNTRRVHTLLLSDDRYWMSDAEKIAEPLR